MNSEKNIRIGDRVQIKIGSSDLTTNKKVTISSSYREGSSTWATVESIDENWKNADGDVETKVRLVNSGNIVVWQVSESSIADNIIHAAASAAAVASSNGTPTEQGITDLGSGGYGGLYNSDIYSQEPIVYRNDMYVTTSEAESWRGVDNDAGSYPTRYMETGKLAKTISIDDIGANPAYDSALTNITPISFKDSTGEGITGATAEEIAIHGAKNISKDRSVVGQKVIPIMADESKRAVLLDDNKSVIQNGLNFPVKTNDAVFNSSNIISAKYDYSINIRDELPGIANLEDRLIEARASFGIPVHGRNDVAKIMRYYMYNRFKVPNTNLAHNKSHTYVFFTRPDLNIIQKNGTMITAAEQCRNHTESAMIWMRHPTLFKLLVDRRRTGDTHNFNLLLSDSVSSFNIQDEELSVIGAGKSWGEYEMQYGDSYSGRTAGEFEVTLIDDKEYSIINLIKLWITYIDNVSRGMWLPSYNLPLGDTSISTEMQHSHVYTKTLDYAASAYVFKVNENGSDILYWSKYYGVFPVNTGASALSWESGSPGDTPKLNIRFKYSYKRDMSPVSLLEFNSCANINSGNMIARVDNNDIAYESQFNHQYAHTNRPFVGPPFVQMHLPNDIQLTGGDSIEEGRLATLRLQFRPYMGNLSDADMFSAYADEHDRQARKYRNISN